MIVAERYKSELVMFHGPIISLFLAYIRNEGPMEIGTLLNLPDCVSIEWPSFWRTYVQ